jgi:ketosteroid isomerase-like protein
VFEWLFEGRIVVYCLLGAVAIVLLVLWRMYPRRGLLVAVVAIAALAGLYFLLDRLVETPREQIERKLVVEMREAVKARDVDAIFKYIAADFRFRGQNREAFHGYVADALRAGLVEDVIIYDVSFPDGGDDRTRPVEFMAKPKAPWAENQPAYRVTAKFVREGDGQWRLQSFEVYNPVLGQQPMDIPNLR